MTFPRVILASGSAIRAEILRRAGVLFDVMKPEVDEDALKRRSMKRGMTPGETAMALAEAKCLSVAPAHDAVVVGADQILEFQSRAYDKPKTMGAARARLLEMQGATHALMNAVAVARGGAVVWRHLDQPKLTMRKLSENEIDAYLDAAGDGILASVGAYQVEKFGARLFDRIEGDYYAVLGLSLLPLLGVLRREGAIDF